MLTALGCMGTCIANDSGTPAHSVPPCHRHHAPTNGTQNSAPCQSHPGLLAYSVHQPSAHIDVPVNLFPAVFEPAPLPREASDFTHTSALPHLETLPSTVLRI